MSIMPHYSLLAADNFSVSLCFCKAAIVNKNFQREYIAGYFVWSRWSEQIVMTGFDYMLKCTFTKINTSVKKKKKKNYFFPYEFDH